MITKQPTDGKNQPIKARLCIRGDLEAGESSGKSYSPTAGKETLKLAIMITANEGFRIKGVNIKSAYLQEQDLERDIFCSPTFGGQK